VEEDKELDGEMKGLGDLVAKVTKATGIDKVADVVAKNLGLEDCGCDQRQKELNQIFPFRAPKNK
jgi:hypothetical protein